MPFEFKWQCDQCFAGQMGIVPEISQELGTCTQCAAPVDVTITERLDLHAHPLPSPTSVKQLDQNVQPFIIED